MLPRLIRLIQLSSLMVARIQFSGGELLMVYSVGDLDRVVLLRLTLLFDYPITPI